MKRAFVITALLLAAFAPFASARAEKEADPNLPLMEMKEAVLSFFTPAEGEVKSIENGIITASIDPNASLREGMRFKVVRKGTPFLHPVTKEPLGSLEENIGVAEVVGAGPQDFRLKVLGGAPVPGDVVRISKARVRLLFYQLEKVSWGLADEYYRILKESNRFELLSTESEKEELAMTEAKRLNADAVLILSQASEENRAILKQSLLWGLDSKEFLQSGAVIESAALKELTLGEELFTPTQDVSVNFKVPFGAELVAMADVDGDGTKELLMGMGRKVVFYSIKSMVLEPALGGVEIKIKKGGELLRLEALDINSDGREEVIALTKDDKEVFSFIYSYEDGKFKEMWDGKLFLRPIEGKLYAQDYDPAEGFKGDIRGMAWENGKLAEKPGDNLTKEKKVPPGVDLYAFVLVSAGGKRAILAFDKDSFLNLYDEEGVLVWRSGEGMGGFQKKYKREAPTAMVERGDWSFKDKIYAMGRDAFVVKRKPLTGVVQGIGYKESGIKMLKWNGLSVEVMDLVSEVPGTIYDFAMDGEKLLVLFSPPLGLELKKILQGESPIARYLSLYPLEGK